MDKISTIKQNILKFIDSQRIRKEDFYKKTDISASNFKGSGLISEIGGDKIVKILTFYPEINPEWLLTGKGEMLRTGVVQEQGSSGQKTEQLESTIKDKDKIIAGLEYKIEVLESQLAQKANQPAKKIPAHALENMATG